MFDREEDSHKGQNGKVMIIGGNPLFHGAPILCALGAEYSGVDLVFPFLPPCHAEVARTYSLNFILQTFEKEILTETDVKKLLHFSEKVDVVVIGPGLGTDAKTKKAIKNLLTHLQTPTVVDAGALIYTNTFPKETVLTPHHGEFTALTGEEPTPTNIQKWAKDLKVTIVCKGREDIIADEENIAFNATGHPLMTVGGTGDVLSGVIGGFMAQGMSAFEAGKYGTKIIGEAGEFLAEKYGSFRAIDIVHVLPEFLRQDD
ncbi:NAD(P)H-hydrate dehydratase [Candidatus Peregrinibacteria bacterium CG_4_10_14_0_2_um_filter_43_11]|nr:MAG: NAD(P)H-hydrate dehydratase [Candidatus Peregrinibacteria bacterium CG_4_10_14_0_2_um_filter_43_11]